MTIRLWDLNTRASRIFTTGAPGHSDHVTSVQVGASWGAAESHASALLRRAAAATTLGSARAAAQISARVLVSSSLDRSLMVWDVGTGRHITTLFGHLEGVWCVKFDALHIVSGSQDGRIIVREWDETAALALDGSALAYFEIQAHSDAITCIDLTESRIVSGSNDNLVRVWDFGPLSA